MKFFLFTGLTALLIGFILGKNSDYKKGNPEVAQCTATHLPQTLNNETDEEISYEVIENNISNNPTKQKVNNNSIGTNEIKLSADIAVGSFTTDNHFQSKNDTSNAAQIVSTAPPPSSPYEKIILNSSEPDLFMSFKDMLFIHKIDAIDEDWSYAQEQNITDYFKINLDATMVQLDKVNCKTITCELWVKNKKDYSIAHVLLEMNDEEWSNFKQLSADEQPSKNENTIFNVIFLKM